MGWDGEIGEIKLWEGGERDKRAQGRSKTRRTRSWATHSGTTVLPTRPHSPQEKANVEATVQHVECQVMAPLRNQTFFSPGELREASPSRGYAKRSGSSWTACGNSPAAPEKLRVSAICLRFVRHFGTVDPGMACWQEWQIVQS